MMIGFGRANLLIRGEQATIEYAENKKGLNGCFLWRNQSLTFK
jgi:hypothetical protein